MDIRFLFALVLSVALGLWGCAGQSAPTVEAPPEIPTALWHDATAKTIGETSDWSNKVELADLNGDGLVDLLFANGGKYREPGEPTASQVFLNQGPGKPFVDATKDVFGEEPMLCRVIKAADVDADGDIDVFFGGTYETASRLMLGDGKGGFTNVSATHLPKHALSLGDAEFGDADLDGDLDLVLATWGEGNPMENEGGAVVLWLNDGAGKFSSADESAIPDNKIRFSWDLEFADVDNDYDLDLMVSSKLDDGGTIYMNDGTGVYTHAADAMPAFTNNYEYEPMDLNGDGYVDSVTINDGGQIEGQRGSHKENVFLNDGSGAFVHATAESLPDSENLGFDDNRVVYLDYDSDGDADVLLASLSGPDRLLINDGEAHFTVAADVFVGPETKGSLCIQLADLDGDARLDVVMAQGEFEGHEAEQILLGKGLAPDTAGPVVTLVAAGEDGNVRARIHDNKAPVRAFDFESVELVSGEERTPMTWYGESLWSAAAPEGDDWKICATDQAGNTTCSE